MSKAVAERTHAKRVRASQEARHLTAEQIRAEKCQRSRSRNLQRQFERMLAAVNRNGKICEKGHKPNPEGSKAKRKAA